MPKFIVQVRISAWVSVPVEADCASDAADHATDIAHEVTLCSQYHDSGNGYTLELSDIEHYDVLDDSRKYVSSGN